MANATYTSITDYINRNLIAGMLVENGLTRILNYISDKQLIVVSGYNIPVEGDIPGPTKWIPVKLNKNDDMFGTVFIGLWQKTGDSINHQDATPDQLANIVESCIMFIKPEATDEATFKELAITLCVKYNHDSVLLRNEHGIHVLSKDGSTDKVATGPFTFDKLGEAYSKLRRKPSSSFIFEGTIQPINNISAYAFRLARLSYICRIETDMRIRNKTLCG